MPPAKAAGLDRNEREANTVTKFDQPNLGDPGFFEWVQAKHDVDRGRRKRRGPFPPTYTVRDPVKVGSFRGVVVKVFTDGDHPSYDVAFPKYKSAELAGVIRISEPDPGLLYPEDPSQAADLAVRGGYPD